MFSVTLLFLHNLAELLVLGLALKKQVEAPTDGKQSQWQESRDYLGIVLGLTRCAVLRLALVLQLLPTHLRRRNHSSRILAHSVLITCSVIVSHWGSVTSSNSIWHSGFLVFSSQWSLTLDKKLALVLTTRKVNNRHFMIEDNNGSAEWANLNIFTFSAWLVVKYC